MDARPPYTAISSSHARALRFRSLLLPEFTLASSAAFCAVLCPLSSSASCSLCARASTFFRFFISSFSALLSDLATPRVLLLPPPNGHARPLVLVRDISGVGEGEGVSGVKSCCCRCCRVSEGSRTEVEGGEGKARLVTVPVALEWNTWAACPG